MYIYLNLVLKLKYKKTSTLNKIEINKNYIKLKNSF